MKRPQKVYFQLDKKLHTFRLTHKVDPQIFFWWSLPLKGPTNKMFIYCLCSTEWKLKFQKLVPSRCFSHFMLQKSFPSKNKFNYHHVQKKTLATFSWSTTVKLLFNFVQLCYSQNKLFLYSDQINANFIINQFNIYNSVNFVSQVIVQSQLPLCKLANNILS